MKLDLERAIETAIVVIIFGALLYMGPGSVFRHSLSNTYPVQYGATDGFSYMMLSEWAYDTGQYQYNPPYESMGFKDVISYHPPIFMQLSAIIAHTAGLAVYDAVSLLMGLAVIMSAFTFYVLIRAYNRSVALLSLPAFFFLYKGNFTIGYLWGESLLLLGSYFLVVLFLLFNNKSIYYFWVLAGIMISGTILTHTSETIFFYSFIIFLFVMKLIFRHIRFYWKDIWSEAKPVLFATILALVISSYYLPVFYNGYYKYTAEVYTSFEAIAPEDYPLIRAPRYYDFPLILGITLALGAAISIAFIMKKPIIAFLSGGFMFIVGFTNYIGLNYRAFQTRFMWPVYVSVFLGIVLYLLLQLVLKSAIPEASRRHGKTVLFASGLGLAVFLVFAFTLYTPLAAGGIYPEQYDAFKWIDKNTPPESRVLLLYGDGYSQSGRIIKRLSYQFLTDEYAKLNLSNRIYLIQNHGLEMGFMSRKGFLDFDYHAKEGENITTGFIPRDICGFDYYIIDKASAYAPTLAQANVMLGNLFIKNGMQPVYGNEITVILKNPTPSGDCLAQ